MKTVLTFVVALVSICINVMAQTSSPINIEIDGLKKDYRELTRLYRAISISFDSLSVAHHNNLISQYQERLKYSTIKDSLLRKQNSVLLEKEQIINQITAEPSAAPICSPQRLEIEATTAILCNNDRYCNTMDLNLRHSFIRETSYSLLGEGGINLDVSKLSGTTIPAFVAGFGFDCFLVNSSHRINNVVPVLGVSIAYSYINISDYIDKNYFKGADQGIVFSGRFGIDFQSYGLLAKISWRQSYKSNLPEDIAPYSGLKISLGGKIIF